MVGVGRDLCESPSPTPCQSRVTQSRLHRTSSRRVLNISRGDSTTSLGSLFQGSITLKREEVLPRVQAELPMLQFVKNELAQCVSCPPVPHAPSLVFKYTVKDVYNYFFAVLSLHSDRRT